MMIADQRWTQTHITELRRLLDGGRSLAEIAEVIQRPEVDVSAMMARLRLKARR